MADRGASEALTRAWWGALGGRNALSLWSWLLPTLAAVAFTCAFEVPAFGYRLWPRVALILGVQGLLIPIMMAGRAILRRQSRPRPWLGIALFVVLGASRGAFIFVCAPYVEPIARDYLPYQIALNVTYALLTLPFIAVMVDSIRRYRELRDRVRDEGRRWERALRDAEAQFAVEFASYREKVDTDVMARVVHLQDEIASAAREAAGAGAVAGADELRKLSAEVVRPLSHELILEQTSIRVAPAPFGTAPPRLDVRDVLRDASRAPLAGHWGICIVMGLLGLVGLSLYRSAPLLGVNLLWDLLIFGVVPTLAAPLISRAWSRLSVPWAWSASVALWSAFAVVGVLGTGAVMDLILGDGIVFWAAAIAYVVLSGLSVIAVAGFRRQLILEAELTEVLAQQEALAARLMRRIEHERRELGLVLHGSVQASLTRAAMALDRWGETFDQASLPAVVAEVRAALDAVVSAFEAGAPSQATLDDVVRERLRLWEGAVECQASVSAEAVAAADAAVAKSVGDIVGEAITNAMRHGQAESIDVDVTLSGAWIVVRVRDDGHGPVVGRHPGAGLGALGRAGLSWDLERVGSQTLLTVRVPAAGSGVLETEQAGGPSPAIA